MQAFQGCASAAKGDVKEALRKTYGELDSLIAARGRRQGTSSRGQPPALRCNGVIVVLDLASGVCYTAVSTGARSAAAVCSVLGAFNSESSEGRLLCRPSRYVAVVTPGLPTAMRHAPIYAALNSPAGALNASA